MVVVISREKINKKFFIVARDEKKIIAKKRWRKDFTVKKAKDIFRVNGTFDPNLMRTKLKTRPFDEFTDTSVKPKKPKGRPFRFFITGLLKDGRTIGASSRMQLWGSILEAKSEAQERFLETLAFSLKDIYDADEGMKLTNEVTSIKKGVIFNR